MDFYEISLNFPFLGPFIDFPKFLKGFYRSFLIFPNLLEFLTNLMIFFLFSRYFIGFLKFENQFILCVLFWHRKYVALITCNLYINLHDC